MKILVVPPSDWLGHPLSSRLHFIFERLAKRHEVHVIRYPIPLWTGRRESETILHEVKGFPFRDLSLYYIINSPYHLSQLNQILKSSRIDVIVFANILTGTESVILGKKYGVPLVCDYLDHFPESASAYYNNPLLKNIVEESVLKLTEWNLRQANHVVTVSTSFFNWLKERRIQHVSLIPNGVDLDNFKPMDKKNAREMLGIKEFKNKFVATYVGSVENWYNLDVITCAIDMLNQEEVSSVFQIVGGQLRSSNNILTGLVRNTYHTGFVSHKHVSTYINASDVCVLPLKQMTKNLTRPVKLLEYFSCGKPVFSLPNSEIESEFGDAVTFFHNSDELARILLKFVRTPNEFSSKIEKGYEHAKENSWDKQIRSYEQLLKSVVQG